MIARSHGGTLEVESTVEGGTTFTARLPVGV
jgi:signal transduction histidine kinase